MERYLKCKVILDHKCYIEGIDPPYIEFKKDQEFLFKVEEGRYFLKGKTELFTLNRFEIDKTDFENFFISKREENLNSILNS